MITRIALALCALALWTGSATAVPPNDDCSAATAITTLPFTDTLDVAGATIASEDSSPCDQSFPSQSVWYGFTAAAPAAVTVDTALTNYSQEVVVFEGTCAAKTAIACRFGFFRAVVPFTACPGKTYLILA